ncbi:MAG: sulfotransferase domain-containing protein [Planctomycetota bacterium]|jgi:hypothetical protein
MNKIDFLIIGAQKAGTTTLYDWLKQHPDIFMPRTKENLYFIKDEFYNQGPSYLDRFYKDYSSQKVVGGTYTHLIYFPISTERIYNYNPQMKIIALLRNPVDRAYSAYWFARRVGRESCKTFEEAIEQETKRIKGAIREQRDAYLAHGHYSEQLERYIALFSRKKVYVVIMEDLKDNPSLVFDGVLEFLGLLNRSFPIDFSQVSNKASIPKISWLQRLLFDGELWFKKPVRKIIPPDILEYLRQKITRPILRKNTDAFEYPPMSQTTRNRLVEYFRPHNERLEQLLERKLNWDH